MMPSDWYVRNQNGDSSIVENLRKVSRRKNRNRSPASLTVDRSFKRQRVMIRVWNWILGL